MDRAVRLSELTVPQRSFAEREGATPQVWCGSDAICLYRETPAAVYRWIVDRDGAVVDEARFARTP